MKYIVLSICIVCLFVACTLDNYDRPTARISGAIYDKETNELIEQDIIRGTQIEYKEGRFTTIQYLNVKENGTFQYNHFFNGTYLMAPKRGNFEPIDYDTVVVHGDAHKDFYVMPFLRIKSVSIFKNGGKVKAMFKIQQTGFDNVLKIGLFAGTDRAVGANVNLAFSEVPIGAQVSVDQFFTVELNTSQQTRLKAGNTYFFRVGAIIDAPEAKFNYAPAVKLTI